VTFRLVFTSHFTMTHILYGRTKHRRQLTSAGANGSAARLAKLAVGSECLTVDDVACAPLAIFVLVHGESDVVWVADARRGDVELAVAEARRRQEDAHTIERLALRLMNPASQEPNLESPSAREARVRRREWLEREMSARHGEGHTHGDTLGLPPQS
jgi:hypothetical protein